MNEEYWTIEHAEKIEENMEEAEKILSVLNEMEAAHEKGGIYYRTTKKLLEAYRSLRFDTVNEKMLKVVETADVFDKDNMLVTLDNILSMPDVYEYYSKEVDRFVSSSIPVTMGLFVHVVDTGIRILSFTERKDSDIKYSEMLKAIYVDEEQEPEALFKQFHTNRSTFYRKKDEAITALSIIIFGPFGGRHPSLIIDDNKFSKKFAKFLDMATNMDLISDLADITERYE